MWFWLLLHPLVAALCLIQARRCGICGKPWTLAALLIGPFILPLWFNHRRLRWRQALGQRYCWFRP